MKTDDFAQDFKLMIQNAKAFNQDGSAVYVVCNRARCILNPVSPFVVFDPCA